MINFRYHVVSIIAIFLALGFGLLFGVTFLDESVVESLERQQKRLGERNEQLHKDNGRLEEQLEKMIAFADSSLPLIVRGSLRDRVAVVITFEDSKESVVENTIAALGAAGAQVDSVVSLSQNLDMSTDERRRQAAVIAETASADNAVVKDALASRTAAALAGTAPGFLQRMADNGAASIGEVQGVPGKPLRELAQPGSAIVIVQPEDPQEDLEQNFLLPVLRKLSEAQAVCAVVEESNEQRPFLSLIRGDGTLRIVTVDGLESSVGRAGLSLGLEAAFAGRFGHYGFGEGATSVLPEQPAT
ncbi:MAG TPA: copper transporter [Actinomycetota bacterium]|nr:copper transporter [Actinomycetota bacterium]